MLFPFVHNLPKKPFSSAYTKVKDEADAPSHRGSEGPVADLLLGVLQAHQVVDNPEIAVVEVAEEERADARGEST